jgi:hypothetical protein
MSPTPIIQGVQLLIFSGFYSCPLPLRGSGHPVLIRLIGKVGASTNFSDCAANQALNWSTHRAVFKCCNQNRRYIVCRSTREQERK